MARIKNISSDTYQLHDTGEAGSPQFQPGIKNVQIAAGATVQVSNADAATSLALARGVADGKISILDYTEPTVSSVSVTSRVPGLAAGIQVISRSIVSVTTTGTTPTGVGTAVVTLPTGVTVGAVSDYMVLATPQDDATADVRVTTKTLADFVVNVNQATNIGVGAVKIAVLVLKIV